MSTAGVSRQFGFLRFADVQSSTRFLEKNHPTIYLYGNGASNENEQSARVRIAFSRERDDRDRPAAADAEWRCRNVSLTESCYAKSGAHPIVFTAELLSTNRVFSLPDPQDRYAGIHA